MIWSGVQKGLRTGCPADHFGVGAQVNVTRHSMLVDCPLVYLCTVCMSFSRQIGVCVCGEHIYIYVCVCIHILYVYKYAGVGMHIYRYMYMYM